MSVRTFALRILWCLGLCAALIALGEAWLRWRLFGSGATDAELRDPDLYTWRYDADGRIVRSDDHAKLALRWGGLDPDTTHPHALLGWCGELDSTSLLPRGLPDTATDAPLLLLGEGWHAIADPLPHDSAIHRTVVDLSVKDFALDQDLLLLETVRPRFTRPLILLLIDIDRLDLLQRAFPGRPKPWYTLDVYAGERHGVPVITDPLRYVEAHPPDPGLYIYHLFRSHVLHDTVCSPSAVEARELDLRELAQKLLFVQLHAAVKAGAQVEVIFTRRANGPLSRARQEALLAVCDKVGVPAHDLPQAATKAGIVDPLAIARRAARSTDAHATLDLNAHAHR